MYSVHGDPISDALGNSIETGSPTPLEVYVPGEQVPDYWLMPPKGLNILGLPRTLIVDTPTRLSDLLAPNMGRIRIWGEFTGRPDGSSRLDYGDRMTWFADLCAYTYLPETVPPGQEVLTVGWLEPEHSFPTGEVTKEFADELELICAGENSAQSRGFHYCRLPHPDGEPEELFSITLDGEQKLLGSAEVRVRTESGTILAAPDLICHYVNYHHYLPPQEFIDAVLARRPSPPDYNSYRE